MIMIYSFQPDEEVVEWKDMGTRHCYYCVPIPGETFWVKKISFSYKEIITII